VACVLALTSFFEQVLNFHEKKKKKVLDLCRENIQDRKEKNSKKKEFKKSKTNLKFEF
jgi:hypothetical protein